MGPIKNYWQHGVANIEQFCAGGQGFLRTADPDEPHRDSLGQQGRNTICGQQHFQNGVRGQGMNVKN